MSSVGVGEAASKLRELALHVTCRLQPRDVTYRLAITSMSSN
jgi:hypothetical protein